MSNKSNSKIVSIIISVLVVIGIIALLVWLFNESQTTETASTTQETSETTGTVDDQESMLTRLNDNPAEFTGQTVTVQAEVQDVITNRIFKISDDTAGDEITVVTPQALTDGQATQAEEFLQDNANVKVTGVVRLATVAEFERDYLLEIASDAEAEFENKYVIVAETVEFTDQSDGLWEFNIDEAEPATETESSTTQQ